jgi:hypothetical protein
VGRVLGPVRIVKGDWGPGISAIIVVSVVGLLVGVVPLYVVLNRT